MYQNWALRRGITGYTCRYCSFFMQIRVLSICNPIHQAKIAANCYSAPAGACCICYWAQIESFYCNNFRIEVRSIRFCRHLVGITTIEVFQG